MSRDHPTEARGFKTIRRILSYAVPYSGRIALIIGLTATYSACLALRLGLIGLLIDGILLQGSGGERNSVALKAYRAVTGVLGSRASIRRSYKKLDPFSVLIAKGDFKSPEGDTTYRASNGKLVGLWLPGTKDTEGKPPNGGYERPFLRMEVMSRVQAGENDKGEARFTAKETAPGKWRFTNGEVRYQTGSTLSMAERQDYILAFCAISIFLAFAIGLTGFAKNYFSRKVYLSVTADIRSELFTNLSRQSVAFFDRRKSGDLVSRTMNDANLLQSFLRFFFDNFLEQPFTIIFSLAAAFVVHPLFTLGSLPFLIGLFYPVWRTSRRVKKHGKRRMVQLGAVTEAVQQLFSGIRILKAFNMEGREQNNFAEANNQYIRKALKMEKAKITSRSMIEALYNIGVAVLILGVGYLLVGEANGLGNFGIFLGAVCSMYRPLKRITRGYNNLQETLAGAERVFEVVDKEPEIQDRPGALEFDQPLSSIEFQDVSFRYEAQNGNLPVLRQVSFKAEVGEVIGIVGPSGAGKSTLVDLIPRFYEPQEGGLLINGTDSRRFTQQSLLKQIAIVGQDPFLFNTTVMENLKYGRIDATKEEAIQAAKQANIHDVIAALPQGYDTEIGDRGATLSGGERQRLTLARAILKNAPLLILDEATSALDSESERLIQSTLQSLMKGRLTLLIAHRLSTVTSANRILVMEKGTIVETGTHHELLKAGATYARMYRLQQSAN